MATTFRSTKYPSLVVKFSDRERVKFENGSAEVEGDLARRLAEHAERHPESGIEVDGEVEKPETPKQRLQREARERGLDESGTTAELQARIDEHDNSEPDGNDNPGDDDLDDEDDDTFE